MYEMETTACSVTLAPLYKTLRRHISERHSINNQHCENLRSH